MNQVSEEKMLALRSFPLSIRLKRLRCLFGYTQKDIAQRLETTQNTVSSWERGKCVPSGKFFERMIELYHLPYDFFVDLDTDDMERNES